MKKIILTFICCLMMSHVVFALGETGEKCANGAGSVIEGHNGQKYCRGITHIDWWNATTWCRANGMELINLSEDCNCPTDICTTTCPNWVGYNWGGAVWTSISYNQSTAFAVYLNQNGGVGQRKKTMAYGAAPLCVQR